MPDDPVSKNIVCVSGRYHLKKRTKIPEEGHLKKCMECGSACCRYITVNIPTPRSMLDFDNILWQMSHRDVKAFQDAGGWYLLVCNPCEFLTKRGLCSVYEERPITCRQHSAGFCEYDSPMESSSALYFDDSAALKKFCRKKFKNWHRRFDDQPA